MHVSCTPPPPPVLLLVLIISHLTFSVLSDTQGQRCLLKYTLDRGFVSFKLMCTWSWQPAHVWTFLLSTSDLSGKAASAFATVELWFRNAKLAPTGALFNQWRQEAGLNVPGPLLSGGQIWKPSLYFAQCPSRVSPICLWQCPSTHASFPFPFSLSLCPSLSLRFCFPKKETKTNVHHGICSFE